MIELSRILGRAVVIGSLVVLSATATASASDKAMIEYRKATYKAVGGHMSAAVAIIKGEVPFKEDLAGHAEALADLAKMALHVFPEGSGDGDTRVLSAVWEKPDEFKKVQEGFVTAAAAFSVAAQEDPRAAAAALSALGQSCKACHDNFRSKQ